MDKLRKLSVKAHHNKHNGKDGLAFDVFCSEVRSQEKEKVRLTKLWVSSAPDHDVLTLANTCGNLFE